MKKEKLLQLIERHNGSVKWHGRCHDCGKEMDVEAAIGGDSEVMVSGGAVYEAGEIIYLKCDLCFKKNQTLRNYQDNLVYSRVVGYLQPVENWNPGKQEEFKNRKTFDKNMKGIN